MAKKSNSKKTQIRFFGSCSPREDLLGVLGYPTVLDADGTEFTRFCMVRDREHWGRRDFTCDMVGVVHTSFDDIRCWWLADKRGQIHVMTASGISLEVINDAGTGPGKYGYLSSLKLINRTLYTCGFSRQIYRRTPGGWTHDDKGILADVDNLEYSLEDIAGLSDGTLCAVGWQGEIAIRQNNVWRLENSPTRSDLHAVCSDNDQYFYAAGEGATLVRGSASGFEVLSSGSSDDTFWDIQMYRGEPVMSASSGLFCLRNDKLVPFDNPAPPKHVGYKLAVCGDLLWSIGTHQVFYLKDGQWIESICPDNQ